MFVEAAHMNEWMNSLHFTHGLRRDLFKPTSEHKVNEFNLNQGKGNTRCIQKWLSKGRKLYYLLKYDNYKGLKAMYSVYASRPEPSPRLCVDKQAFISVPLVKRLKIYPRQPLQVSKREFFV